MTSQPPTARDLCLHLANTAMRLADSLAVFPDDLAASAEWVEALGDAEYALDTALGIGVDALLPPAREGTYSTGRVNPSAFSPRSPLVIEDGQPVPASDRLSEIRLLMQTWSSARFLDVGHTPAARSLVADAGLELFAEIDRLTAALQAAEQREAELRAAVNRMVSFMDCAPELWGNPAADSAIARLRRAAAPAGSDQKEG